MNILDLADRAVELGYSGQDLSIIVDALFEFGIDLEVMDNDYQTNDLVLQIEKLADSRLGLA